MLEEIILIFCISYQVTQTDDDIVRNARIHCKNAKAYFYRLTPTLRDNIELDEIDNEKLINGMWHAKAYVLEHADIFAKIAERLSI